MKKLQKVMLLVCMLPFFWGAKTVWAEQTNAEVAMPKIEMIASDFTVTQSEAQNLTAEIASNDEHGNVQFINQRALINLLALVEATPSELETINQGAIGTYPLTLFVDFNEERLQVTMQVTIVADVIPTEHSLQFIFVASVGIVAIGVLIFWRRKS